MLLEHGADISSPGGKLRVRFPLLFRTAIQICWLGFTDPTRMRPDVLGVSSYIYDLAARAHKDVALSFLINYQPPLSRHYALRTQW
jgi:hypothetical protein